MQARRAGAFLCEGETCFQFPEAKPSFFRTRKQPGWGGGGGVGGRMRLLTPTNQEASSCLSSTPNTSFYTLITNSPYSGPLGYFTEYFLPLLIFYFLPQPQIRSISLKLIFNTAEVKLSQISEHEKSF